MINDMKGEVIVPFVAFDQIVVHHCLSFLFIIEYKNHKYKIFLQIIYDINPGTCKDSLSLKDKSGPEMKITGQGASPTGTKILSVSKQVDITLITCYHFGMTGDKSFELKLENKGK